VIAAPAREAAGRGPPGTADTFIIARRRRRTAGRAANRRPQSRRAIIGLAPQYVDRRFPTVGHHRSEVKRLFLDQVRPIFMQPA